MTHMWKPGRARKLAISMSRALGLAALVVAIAGTSGLAEAQSDDEEDALLVSEARAAIANKDYDKAAQLLDRALQLNPRRVDAYVLRATVHGINKEYTRGIALMRQARELAPDNPNVLTTLGRQLAFGGRPDEAAPIFERVVTDWPERFEAHLLLGSYYVDSKEWPKAITAYEAYLKTRPRELEAQDATHRLDLANAYLRSGNPQRSTRLYQQVLSEKPNSVLAKLGVAWSTAAVDCRKAIPLLTDMQDLADRYVEILVVRARCALLMGDVEQALTVAEAYREKRGDSPGAWALLAEARVANQDYKGAMEAMTEASKKEPDNRLYVLKLARIERLAGEPEKAIARLRAAEPPAGAENRWAIELGEGLAAAGKYAELRREFASFVAENPSSAPAQTLLGIAIYELGEPEVAIDYLEQAIKLDARQSRARPPLVNSLNILAVNAFSAGELDKAEQLLVRAEDVGKSAMTWRNLGAIRLLTGKVEAAVAPLKSAAGAAPNDPVAHLLLGRAYYATGDSQGALKLYARAVTLTPKSNRDLRTKINLDQSAAMIAIGDGNTALALLENALDSASSPEQRTRVATAYITAARKLATDEMSKGNFPRAHKLLGQVATKLPKSTTKEARNGLECDLALAATGAGRSRPALKLLRSLEKRKARCPFVAPADELAVQILIAWNEGATARTARKALRRLNSMRRKATGPAEPLVRTAARDIAFRAAIDAYRRNKVKKARQLLETARRYDPQSREIDHNLAVLDISSGRIDKAIRALESTSSSVPEALINLGIAHERKSQPKKALGYFRRAISQGTRAAMIREWVARKERLWGKQ